VLKAVAFAGLAVLALAGLSAVVMLLWNALLPGLFGAPPLRYPQAAGLLILTRVLFGGWRGHRGHWRGGRWRERWESLSPEERERLRAKYARHCRWQGSEPASENPQL
jgi:hypothetical protein